jgi:MFS family permease
VLKKYFEPGALFSYVGFRNLWLSTGLTNIGMTAFPIALAVAVLDSGGDATTLGLILAARLLSGVLLAPIGGVWADRLPRKLVIIVSDSFRATMSFVLVFVSTPQLSMWIMAALVFLMGASDAFGSPASQAIMPSLLPSEKLPAGNVARGIVYRTSTIVGPGVGGFAVILLGPRITFLVTSIFFSMGAALLFKIQEGFIPKENQDENSFLSELKSGLKVVWETKWVAACIAMASVQLMIVLAAETVLLPVIARREFGNDKVFALSAALFSVGGVISALLAVKFRPRRPGLTAITVWAIFVVAPISLAFPISPLFVIVAYFIAGFSVGPWDAYWSTAIQREIPLDMQG